MKVLFAAGGTGGHLYPAIAIAEELRRIDPGTVIEFAGTKRKIEARVVPQKGYRFHPIWISGFSRRLRWENLIFPVKVVVSLLQSFLLIRKLRPAVVVGTGGYVCGPVLFAASLSGIPTVVHESNSYPGVTTRMLAARVTKVFTTFEVTAQWLASSARTEVVGNPTRAELSDAARSAGAAAFGLSPDKPTIFAFGGSLGAASINSAMPAVVAAAIARGWQVLWQTGETDKQAAATVPQHPDIKVMTYVDRMDLGYAAADLVVCRSGATTLAELTRLGKPAILVPYPFAAANHQELNAEAMVKAGAAVMLKDALLQKELTAAVERLMTDAAARAAMAQRSLALGRPDAGMVIAQRIRGLAVA
ncbi:MAG: undecaprenyldiphospho-muramoylpentapeptide beta-N-acetylglucosaminyltransferase [Bacteroidetes bacterium]|nr:undecaprenyldiphospho-muramoylpentapeptide beta-N-acetylglucosaminyltransferase [Bacteroidota bacterium]